MKTRTQVANGAKMFLIGSMFLVCQSVSGQKLPTNEAELDNLAGRNQEIVLRDLRPLLKATGGAGRLYVHAKCLGDSENILFFPRIEVTKRKAGATAIQEALAKNKNVRIAERRPGVTGIWIGDVSNDLLSTRIRVLRLGDRERYNYTKAIAAIIDTQEVQAKMREARMDAVPEVAIYPSLDPDPKLPHLPATMTNVTVDEALDQIARTFGGLVIYWECNGENTTRLFSLLMHEL